MATSQVDLILTQVQQLSPHDQMQLIQRLLGLLTKSTSAAPSRGLVYGKYRNAGAMSTEEDFKPAEWHLSDKDVNGE
jgi:hypothetical protein